MLISRHWLSDYIDLSDLSDTQLADTLTQLGLEVESLTSSAPLDPRVVVAEVLEAVKHPNADSLRLCKVTDGSETLSIVCGAPNARAGIRVALARVGAVLPGNFQIKESKIRGELSQGMMCSEKELTLSDEHAGIIELSHEHALGSLVKDIFRLDDTVMEVSITPNRGDCLSYLGIARDLSAKLKRPLKTFRGTRALKINETPKSIKLAPDAKTASFASLEVKGVAAVASPAWLASRLKAHGMRPINLIVDASNFVMLEMGQPNHIYDKRFLAEGRFQVRGARVGESLTTLDGKSVSLEQGDILICDGDTPVGLGGIMGGLNSEVKDDTTDIVIEAASFDPAQIRKTSKRLALHTDASYRFERGIDRGALLDAAYRVAEVIEKASRDKGTHSVEVAPEINLVEHTPVVLPKIALRLERTRSVLGLAYITAEKCIQHLEALGLKLLDRTDDRMLFEVPSWRQDLVREVDLIEEVGRLEGFERIPYELPRMNIQPNPEHPFLKFQDRVRRTVASFGLSEAMTYPFLSLEDYRKLLIPEDHILWPKVRLMNALNEERSYMQTFLLPSLLEAVLRNRRHGEKGAKLFEVGRGYFQSTSEENPRPTERIFLAGALDSPVVAKTWETQAETAPCFFHAKSVVVRLAEGLGIAGLRFVPMEGKRLPYLHPGASAEIFSASGESIGYVGELHPRVSVGLDFGLEGPVVFELDLERWHRTSEGVRLELEAPRRFPPVMRDLALVVEHGVSFDKLSEAAHSFPQRKHLKSMELFDVYAGEGIPEGKKSVASNFVFASADKTLTDKDVETELGFLLKHLESTLGAKLR